MKIVICYSSSGGYECGAYDHVRCFEYESLEAFYVHFEEACQKAKADYEQLHDDHYRWERSRLPSHHKKSQELQNKEFKEWVDSRPDFVNWTTNFTFLNCEFDWTDFFVGEAGEKVFSPPEIYELMDWFHKHHNNP